MSSISKTKKHSRRSSPTRGQRLSPYVSDLDIRIQIKKNIRILVLQGDIYTFMGDLLLGGGGGLLVGVLDFGGLFRFGGVFCFPGVFCFGGLFCFGLFLGGGLDLRLGGGDFFLGGERRREGDFLGGDFFEGDLDLRGSPFRIYGGIRCICIIMYTYIHK
jgi:hypothetical protein